MCFNNNLKFSQFNIKDKNRIQAFIDCFQPESCEYNFANLFAWRKVSKLSWTTYQNRLLIYDGEDSKCSFMPLGKEFAIEELAILSEKLKETGLSPDFNLVSPKYIDKFSNIINYYSIKKELDHAEYIYDVQKLEKLSGRKLQKKRNLISQFKRLYPGYKVNLFKKKDISSIIVFAQTLLARNNTSATSNTLIQEFYALKKACEYFDFLDLEGLMMSFENKIVAFSIFSKLNNDTYDIHFEKADICFRGASQVINHETAKYLKDKCSYLNREQDLGIKGLRQAKMSYEPLRLIVPYTLVFIR